MSEEFECDSCGYGWDYADDAETCCDEEQLTCENCGDEIDGWTGDLCNHCTLDTRYYDNFESSISRTFDKLEKAGIFARADWQCCQSCGCAAIPEDDGHRGYAFYHEQDKDAAIEESQNGAPVTVYLAYGCINSSDDNTVKIGHEIKDALEDDGFTVDWDGSAAKRMVVSE
jgi:hypothetical protein